MAVTKPAKGKIIVFGIYFWYPLAGVTYQFIHYMMGLKRLGYDPYYIEDSGRYVWDPKLNDFSADPSNNIQAVAPILESFGFKNRWAFRGAYPGGKCFGMTEEEIFRLYRDADACLNVCGAQEFREEHLRIRRRIYVETDPVAAQIKVFNGDQATIDTLAAHHRHFSFGENFGSPDCQVPLGRFNWMTTRQPVVMDLWTRKRGGGGETWNTIATWRNKGKDITYKGESYYWSKDREFAKFLDLPVRRPESSFELATGVDGEDRERLLKNNWKLRDPVDVSQDPDLYRDYIQKSRGEFTVAKDQNIRLRSGWFSDRSACYLASSRPVINQETGFSNCLPTGLGLFAFESMADILLAMDAIESDYEAHCKAARDIAEEYFSAEKVLKSLLDRAGL